jgi:hypothetical protein
MDNLVTVSYKSKRITKVTESHLSLDCFQNSITCPEYLETHFGKHLNYVCELKNANSVKTVAVIY